MIKRLSVIVALGIALSLSACGNTDNAVNEPTEAEKVTEAIESTPEVTEETTISATGTKVTVYLEYKDLEQYKEAFLRFAKPFSDTDIEKCWEQVLADDTRVIEFDGFSTETSKFNGDIEYMSIYGSIE